MTVSSDDGSGAFAIQGISLATYSNGGYDGSTVADYEANAVQSGANYVALSNVSYVDLSSGMISDAYSGSEDQTATFSSIDAAIKSAEAQGLSVMLKPQLVTDDPAYAQYTSGSWINLVDPNLVIANPAVFFANYKAYILQWAELAQKDNVAVLSIGNEMVAATKPQYTPYWDDIIAAIRQVYHGELTYSALLPLQVNSTTNEVSQIGFWDKLDFAGFDVYPSLSQGADPSVASLNAAWTNESVYGTPQDYAAFVAQMAAEVGKPVVFTETGLPSFAGASDRQTTSDGDIGSNSANGGAGVTADDAEQANWWQSFFDTWAVNKPSWLQGVFVYNNDPENLGSYAATNYNIIGKTAEGVVASWFGGKTVVSPLSDTLAGSIANDKLYLYGPNSATASSSSSQQAQTLDTVVSVTVTAAIENGASPALHVIINGQDFGTVQIAPTDSGYVASDGVHFTTNQTFTFDLPGLVDVNSLQVGFVGTDDPTHEYSTFFQSVSVDGVALTNLTYTPNAEYGGASAQVLPDANGDGGTSSQWGGGVSAFDATPWNTALAARTAGSAADPIQVNGGGGVDTVYVLGAMNQYTLTSEGGGVYLLSESSNLGQNAVLTGVSYIAFADGGEIAVNGAIPTAQVLTGALAGQAIMDTGVATPFATMSVSDPDIGGSETVTITVSNTAGGMGTDANGVLSGVGLTQTGAGVYTLSGSPAAVTSELQALSFTPIAHEVAPGSSVTTDFTVSVSDGMLSAADSSTSVTVTASETAPTLTGAVAAQAISDAAITTPFAAMSVSDPDVGAGETVTLTLSNTIGGPGTDANGQLNGAGLTHTGAGVYILSGSPAAVTAELQALSFMPTLHEVAPGSSVTTHFTVSVSDGALSATDTTTAVIATAGDTAPVISGAVASQAISDAATTNPFAAMNVSDPDVGAAESVTLTLSDAAGGAATDANGVLSGAGLTHVGAGEYTLSGSPAAVTAELQALSFTPTLHEVAAGSGITTYFDVVVSDGVLSAADDSTSVTATGSALAVQVLFDGSAGHAFEVSQNAASDTLIGGPDDALYGGTGADTFVIPDVAASTPTAFDTIVDFTLGQDTLDLSGAAQGAVVLIHEGQVTYLEYAPDANGDGGYQGFAIVQDDLLPSDLKLAAGTEVTSYLYGSSPAGQAETLDGTAGHLIVESSAGAETLLAGQGDTLYGSSGVDDFVVGSLGASPITDYDVVAGFKSGTDHLDISATDGGHVEIAYFEGDAFVYYDPVGGAFQGLVQVIGPVTPDDLILSAAARANGVVIQGDMTEGSTGHETLQGGAGADYIYAGSGADTLIGGGGADFLVGGPGADTFAYTAISDSTTTAEDLIYNFTPAKGDIIDLTRLDASVGVSGHFVEAFDGHAGEYELVAPSATSAYWQLEGDLTGSGHADFQVAFAVWGTTTDYQSVQAHIHL